ncbi:Rha family transcriptional regulator [Paenibacillus sp. TAB 01]|uniref:Rha family transcriptional regulator n=1 Tax=Paenibacillus sp. TAB 01 TaxID=3368988 RepID=UPI0037500885
MTQLKIVNQNGQLLVDSRDVAEMTEKRHADLLRDIDGYKSILDQNANLRSDQFFIEGSYEAGTGKPYRLFLLTRKGCDMVANKMTGEKGVLFTAAYVTRFEEMEREFSKPPRTQLEILQASISHLVNIEREQAEQSKRLATVEKKLDETAEILSLNAVDGRKKVTALLNKVAQSLGGGSSYQDVRADSYQRLESRAECNLAIRQTNKRKKMALEGVTKSKIDKVSKLDVIFDDGRLAEIYFAIVKEMAIQNKIDPEGIAV